jgi:hypothetical protein
MKRAAPIILCLIGLVSCGRRSWNVPPGGADSLAAAQAQLPPPPAFAPMLAAGRALDTVMRVDMNGPASPITVVASITLDSNARPSNPLARFDAVDLYAWDARLGAWSLVVHDTAPCGVGLAQRDLLHDARPALIVETYSASGDPIGSAGAIVYSAHGGPVHRVFRALSGAPVFADVDGDSVAEIIEQSSFTGIMPRVDALTMTRAVWSFDGYRYIDATRRFGPAFDKAIAEARSNYAQAKTAVPVGKPIEDELDFALYRPAAQVVASYRAKGEPFLAREFFNGERDYLRRMIPSSQLVDLEAFATAADTVGHP